MCLNCKLEQEMRSLKGLQNHVAMVTGAGRGIGAAIARRLAADGAAVAVLDLKEELCQQTVSDITGAGGTTLAVGCDVSIADEVQAATEKIAKAFGAVDILVNNAGVIRDNLLFKMSENDWDTVMRVHLRGHFLCSRAVQKFMVERNWGKIVNISSTSALGNRGQANYAAAKAGIQGFTKTLALELGPFNINVNAVAPGFIDTEMTRETAARVGLTPEQLQEMVVQGIPLRRIGRPVDIANVVSFLCSEDASYISGQVIYVAGGPKS